MWYKNYRTTFLTADTKTARNFALDLKQQSHRNPRWLCCFYPLMIVTAELVMLRSV